MTTEDEEKLRRGFAKLKEDDARRAPKFEELVKKGPPRPARSPWAVVVPLGSIAAAAAVFLLWCGTQRMTSSEPTAAAPMATAPAPAASMAAADQPAVVQDGKQAAPRIAPDTEPLGFLLTVPGATAAEPTSFLLQGLSR